MSVKNTALLYYERYSKEILENEHSPSPDEINNINIPLGDDRGQGWFLFSSFFFTLSASQTRMCCAYSTECIYETSNALGTVHQNANIFYPRPVMYAPVENQYSGRVRPIRPYGIETGMPVCTEWKRADTHSHTRRRVSIGGEVTPP